MSRDKDNLRLLFQKPLEPLFTIRDNGKTKIDLPVEYYTDRYKTIGPNLIDSRFSDDVEKIVSVELVDLPDLSFADSLGKTAGFSLFNQKHKDMAARLTKIFMDSPNTSEFFSMAGYVRDRVNLYLFEYSLSVAMQHRADTKNIELPSIVQSFPNQFVDPSVFPRAREELSLIDEEKRNNIEIPLNFTANDKETEQCMAYFREGNSNNSNS